MKPNKIFLSLLFGLIALATSAQIWTPTNTRLRYPGYAFQYKDTSDFIGSGDTALLIRQGKDSAYYLKVKGFWRKVNTAGGASSDFINNQFGANLSAQPAKFYITDTGWAAKLLRSNKGLLDSIQASSSAGSYLVTNGGSAVMHWGGGGSVEVDFKGFAGYDANRSSSYTVRSFTDKGYVDSADALRILISDTANLLSKVVRTFGNQTANGAKNFTEQITSGKTVLFGDSTGADYYIRSNRVASTSTGRRGLLIGNDVNTGFYVYAGGNQTIGNWTESDRTMVLGTGFAGGGGSLETILFHSAGIGNMMALSAAANRATIYLPTTLANGVAVGGMATFGGSSGGANRIWWESGNLSFRIRSDFDTLRLQAGADNGSPRDMVFYIGDTRRVWIPRSTQLLTADYTLSTSDNSAAFATTAYVRSNLANYLPLSGGTVSGTGTGGFDNLLTVSGSSSVERALNVSNSSGTGIYAFSSGATAAAVYAESNAIEGVGLLATNIGGGDIALFNNGSGNIVTVKTNAFNSTVIGTFATGGVPLVVNSTNSNGAKIQLQDNGTNRGWIGATSTYSTAFYNSSATLIGGFQNDRTFNITGFSGQGVSLNVGFNGNSNISFSNIGGTGTDNYVVQHNFIYGSGGGYEIKHNADSRWIRVIANTGGVQLSPGNTSWGSVSDSTMKKNIIPIQNGLSKALAIGGYYFDYNSDSTNNSSRIGVLAQQVHAVLPHAVDWSFDNKENRMVAQVKYTELIPLLFSAIRELKQQLDAIKNQ